jgi:hypothetical protein
MNQSSQQLMYNLYNIIALTEVKGYAMVQFSYMMLRIYNKVSKVFSKRMKDYIFIIDFNIISFCTVLSFCYCELPLNQNT